MYNNNPIPITAKISEPRTNIHCNPDPYAFFHDGMYYCYSTGYHGVNVLRSKDLKSFEHMGFALSDENWAAYWAPAVIFYDGLFYMYFSAIPKGETDPHLGYMKVAVADNPLGPFSYIKTMYNEFSIDPHVVEKNGELYMFYAVNITEGEKIGTMVMLDKMLDPVTPNNKPRLVIAPSIEQEIFAKNRLGDGRDWYTIEGAFYFEDKGTGYLMYSANAFMHGDYFVGYSICDASASLDEAVFRKYPGEDVYRPLIGKDEFFTGCGHNSMITGPKGELLIVYHGRDRAETSPYAAYDDGRRLCISEVRIEGNDLRLFPYTA